MLQHTFAHDEPLTATTRPTTIVVISTIIAIAVVGAPLTFTWQLLGACAFLYYVLFGIGFSVGFHRGLIHRTYDAPPFVWNVLALLGTLAGCQGPITTYRSHSTRSFYQSRQNPPPPFDYRHGFIRSAWYFLFVLSEPPANSSIMDVPAEISHSRWMRFLDRHAATLQVVLCILLYIAGGWPLLLWGGIVRLAVTFVLYALLDYFGHRVGRVRYPNSEASTPGYNSTFLGVLMMGEGWHNNHHAVPKSAKFGHAWWEIDLGYVGLRMLAAVRIVKNLTVPALTGRAAEQGIASGAI